MTRLAILSDIHGNLTALEAVLHDLAALEVDQIVVAGDVVNWGPRNVEVMERVVSAGWPVIRGNNELYLLDQDTERAPAQWNRYSITRWTRRQLGARWLNVIATWPDALSLRFRDAPALRVVHGSPRSHFEGMYPGAADSDLAEMLHGVAETTLVAGHTHLPLDRQVGQWHILNPGSVGIPLDGTGQATYLIADGDWSGWRAELRRVDWDHQAVLHDFERLGFAEQCGATGALVMHEIRTARLHVLPFLNWWQAHFPNEPEDTLLDKFLAEVNLWDYTPVEYHIHREPVSLC